MCHFSVQEIFFSLIIWPLIFGDNVLKCDVFLFILQHIHCCVWCLYLPFFFLVGSSVLWFLFAAPDMPFFVILVCFVFICSESNKTQVCQWSIEGTVLDYEYVLCSCGIQPIVMHRDCCLDSVDICFLTHLKKMWVCVMIIMCYMRLLRPLVVKLWQAA